VGFLALAFFLFCAHEQKLAARKKHSKKHPVVALNFFIEVYMIGKLSEALTIIN
jgi:hypothetical protein